MVAARTRRTGSQTACWARSLISPWVVREEKLGERAEPHHTDSPSEDPAQWQESCSRRGRLQPAGRGDFESRFLGRPAV